MRPDRLLMPFALLLAACSSSAKAAPGDGGTSPGREGGRDGAGDVATGDGDVGDAPRETGDPLTELAPCLGTAEPLTVSGQMPYVEVMVGPAMGEFVLDFGSTFSSIDLSAFPSPGPQTSGCNPSQLGSVCTVANFSFFGPSSSVTLTVEDFSGVSGGVRQAGILGTDFLSEHVLTLGYAAGKVFASASSSFCSGAQLMAAGFAPLSTGGYYENDESRLLPFHDVDTSAPSGESVPNVPTVPVDVAGASAVAQLDTGFDDDVTPYSVNVNPAFFDAIMSKTPSALARDAALDATLSTCVSGVTETVQAYKLTEGVAFGFKDISGVIARSYPQATLFVKNTPSAAASCGGIGTWTSPAAQVGASFYVGMQTIVFDPYDAEIWIPRR